MWLYTIWKEKATKINYNLFLDITGPGSGIDENWHNQN